MTQGLSLLDATAQAELVARGELKPIELVEAAIERIARVDPKLNAVIHPLFDKARAEATSPALGTGPFRGVPFLVMEKSHSSPARCRWTRLRPPCLAR